MLLVTHCQQSTCEVELPPVQLQRHYKRFPLAMMGPNVLGQWQLTECPWASWRLPAPGDLKSTGHLSQWVFSVVLTYLIGISHKTAQTQGMNEDWRCLMEQHLENIHTIYFNTVKIQASLPQRKISVHPFIHQISVLSSNGIAKGSKVLHSPIHRPHRLWSRKSHNWIVNYLL